MGKRRKRSSTSTDGSGGIVPSKIRVEKKELFEPPFSMITSLPDDVIFDILARVSRFNYPTLSLVSKHFRSLVSSSELYARRTLLGCTEACIYAVLYYPDTKEYRLYLLRQKGDSSSFVRIPSLLPMVCSFFAVGSKIYVISGKDMLSINCISHTVQPFLSLPMSMYGSVGGTINGKIYVVGYSNLERNHVMLVFNTETQMWDSEITKLGMEGGLTRKCVVSADKMYVRDCVNSFVYGQKENKWELDEMLSSKMWWNACVIDDVLYYYDCNENELGAYDPKQKSWGVVKGVEKLVPKNSYGWSHCVNYGGKLAVLLTTRRKDEFKIYKILCAEIAIERSQSGEIWGKVEWHDVLLEGCFTIMESLSVMV